MLSPIQNIHRQSMREMCLVGALLLRSVALLSSLTGIWGRLMYAEREMGKRIYWIY